MPNDKHKGWLGGRMTPLLLAAGVGVGGLWLIQRRRPGRGITPLLLLAAGVGAGGLRVWWSRRPRKSHRQLPPQQTQQQLSSPRRAERQPSPATRLLVSGEPLPVPVDDLAGWWPLEEPVVGHGSNSDSLIYTFVSQFAAEKEHGLFGGRGACNRDEEAAALPSAAAATATAAAADIEFLRGLDLEGLMAMGPGDAPIHRILIYPAVAAAGEPGEGKHPAYDENNPPTPATLVADLKASANFKSAIADLDDDGSGGPLPYLGYLVFYSADEVHEDENKQYIFCTPEDEAEAAGSTAADCVAAGEDYDRRDVIFRSRAQLAALKRYVLQERVFFVLVHTVRVPVQRVSFMQVHTERIPEEPEPMSSEVLLMALGVSVATGNLVGVIAVQGCHNLCD